MRSSWFPVLLVSALFGLLVLLAALQYKWLGQVSDSERVRLEARLKDDTKRFADDFNYEINLAYTLFQVPEDELASFAERYDHWLSKTANPKLVENIYFAKTGDDELLKYTPKKRGFEFQEWNDALTKTGKSFEDGNKFDHIYEENLALIVPIYKSRKEFEKLFVEADRVEPGKLPKRKLDLPEKRGFLIIDLDEKEIYEKILPALSSKYFAEDGVGSYKILVKNKKGKPVFFTNEESFERSDAEAKLFSLSPDRIFVFGGPGAVISREEKETIIIGGSTVARKRKRLVDKIGEEKNEGTGNHEIDIQKDKRLRIFEGGRSQIDGIWTLGVQHSAGSLDNFIEQTRYRNLTISFGILSLLAISMGLILISSQRARLLAQRQIDFVSSVSHEFRTPLSVIYSAGENLSDGVIDEQSKISSYGTLIKREGKKLSEMVEQILEFAGAKGGSRKYDFKKIGVAEIVRDAQAECDLIIQEKGFEIEAKIDNDLPMIYADKIALTQALQNLISNALKYSSGDRLIKIEARNSEKTVELSVEDFGFGISKKDQKNIFEPFYRSENVVDKQISGNGLGLSLVKQIVDAHGGNINVESEVNKGSRFTIELPVTT